jgi:hypothetical protein
MNASPPSTPGVSRSGSIRNFEVLREGAALAENAMISAPAGGSSIADYLDELKDQQQRFAFKLPNAVSKFFEEIQAFVVEFETLHKEALSGDAKTDAFFQAEKEKRKKFWKLRRKEMQMLKEELQSQKDVGLFDDTRLLNLCNRIASQDKAERKLKFIVDRHVLMSDI